MPAVVRGGSRYSAKPRASAPRGGAGPRLRQPARSKGAPAAKLRTAQRIGLRPGVALVVSALVVGLGLAAAMATGNRMQTSVAALVRNLDIKLAAVGFRLLAVHVEGATPEAQGDILKAIGLHPGEPILALDLGAVRGRVEQVGWVKTARVVRLLPDTLVISIAQRPAQAVWQHAGRSFIVDDQGRPIPEADPARFPDLPLVVGEGANDSASDILPLIRARPRLLAMMEALVRVDDRRWDIRLKDGGLIQLPATGEDSALIQLDQLDQKERILDLGFARIDLRDPEMVAVRPRDGGAPAAAPSPAGV